jgi:hypothetical protein
LSSFNHRFCYDFHLFTLDEFNQKSIKDKNILYEKFRNKSTYDFSLL